MKGAKTHIQSISRRLSGILTRSRSGNLGEERLWVQICSFEYIGIVLWYSLNLTACLYFFSAIGPLVNEVHFCNWVNYIGSGLPALWSLVVGSLLGRLGWGWSTLLTTSSCIMMFLLAAFQDVRLAYVALLLFTVQRSLVFAVFFSFIPVTFGSANYGRLIGIATLFSGVFGLVNGPLSRISGLVPMDIAVCPGGLACQDWRHCSQVNILLATSFVPSVVFSFWLMGGASGLEASPVPSRESSRAPSASVSPRAKLKNGKETGADGVERMLKEAARSCENFVMLTGEQQL